jgi:hypothetical protein
MERIAIAILFVWITPIGWAVTPVLMPAHNAILGFEAGQSLLSEEHKQQLDEGIERLQKCGPPSRIEVRIESGIREGATGPDYLALGLRAENVAAHLAARGILEKAIDVTLYPKRTRPYTYKNIPIAEPYYVLIAFRC